MNENSNNLLSDQKDKILVISKEIEKLEIQLKKYNDIKQSYDDFKSQLYGLMVESGLIKFTSPNGTQFTSVSPSNDKIELILSFNENKFKKENPETYNKYVEQTEKFTKGRAGYLRITLPKEKKEEGE